MSRPSEPARRSHERHAQLVDELIEALGGMFDLDRRVGGKSLRDAVRERLDGLLGRESPCWGTSGSMTEIARESRGALEFFYRPHLFPDMEDRLRLGHQLQFDLLPRDLPPASPARISAVLESYCHLSGDLLGWRLDGDDLLVWIADMAGHGVRAGLAAAVFHFLAAEIEPGLPVDEATCDLSDRLLGAREPQDDRALYATSFLARVSPDGRGSYASAGHPAMLLRRSDGTIERLASTGPPLGLFADVRWERRELDLGGGDLLFLFTDGLTEATDPGGNELGRDWLEELLRTAPASVGDVTRAVYEQISRRTDMGGLEDDLTFLALTPEGRS